MVARDKGKPPSQRQLKVGEMIRHALADIFFRGEIVDEVLNRHSLTVPEVRMSPDLKLATVYVLTLGGERGGRGGRSSRKAQALFAWAPGEAGQHEVHA